ncbi:MAG: hypothetical protein UR53_C0003G0008 [Candidatus Magasanikbacteria bacterium GW2011_GWC2_34_16]|uniref:Uncharacterized protein n=2 Tax=Candidatus Magasanikiibacteriota TaxID=1752731 RepID=A0A0G0JWR4_9BACT|nr:MAG: hypothetical protein UR53_C0003G0008 [Candidatus Magasanikbacteria bacterium GW2011_GWC2_34_16]KKQ41284.1 MAG: hypothetical protein US58_C0002G0007 [Candidatus Magasanikbacteria bacterium GW2011_GWA2_37_8]
MEAYFKKDVGKILQDLAKQDPEMVSVLLRWQNLKLDSREVYLLGVLSPIDGDDWEEMIGNYERLVKYLRGEVEDSFAWYSADQVLKLEISSELLVSEDFGAQFLYSLSLWHVGYYTQPVLELLKKFETYTSDDFLFSELEDELAAYYSRVCLLLFTRYYADLYDEWQVFVLNSFYLQLAITLGIDLGVPITQAIDKDLLIVDRRQKLAIFATMVYDNKWPVGKDLSGNEVKLSYWVDRFRAFNRGIFDGINLLNFINQKEEWKNCSEPERMIVREALYLYSGLLGNQFVVTEEDLAFYNSSVINRKPEKFTTDQVKNIVNKNFIKDINGEYEDLSGVLKTLNQLSEDHNDPAIAELYYFDEADGKFKWKE